MSPFELNTLTIGVHILTIKGSSLSKREGNR